METAAPTNKPIRNGGYEQVLEHSDAPQDIFPLIRLLMYFLRSANGTIK
jgi:hypothetical protein